MARLKRQPLWIRTINSKIFFTGSILFLILILSALGKESLRRYEVNKKISLLKQEISVLEEQKENQRAMIVYLQGSQFQEKEARLKLGLKKPGESVIIIPEEKAGRRNGVSQNEGSVAGVQETKEDKSLNPSNWWHYFFGSN